MSMNEDVSYEDGYRDGKADALSGGDYLPGFSGYSAPDKDAYWDGYSRGFADGKSEEEQ